VTSGTLLRTNESAAAFFRGATTTSSETILAETEGLVETCLAVTDGDDILDCKGVMSCSATVLSTEDDMGLET
jgi:hypothetical protein